MVGAAEVVAAYVAEQSSIVLDSYGPVLDDAPDAIHAARVACRRLRSTLRTYGSLWLDGQGKVRRHLAWYARLLGPSRDLEVVSAWLAELPSDPRLASASASALEDLHQHAQSRRAATLTAMRRELDRERFDALAALLPPLGWAPLAEVEADRILPQLAAGQVVRLHAEVAALPIGAGRVDALHEVRKAAKQVRYAYEVLGRSGATDASYWKGVTEALGVAQDAAVASFVVADLRELQPEHVQLWDAVDTIFASRAATAEAEGLALVASSDAGTA
jgi:CHAD domain-containing protein